MGKIKVVHVIQGRHFGGAEQVVLSLGKELDRARFEMRLVCLSEGLLGEKSREVGVETTLLPMHSKLDLRVVPRLVRFIRREGVAVVHTHSVRSNLVGRLAARIVRVPIVTHLHSPVRRDSASPGRNLLNAWIDGLTAPWAQRYIAVSHSLREELLRRGMPPDRVLTIHNGIDSGMYATGGDCRLLREELGLAEGTPTVGLIALLRPRKGAEYLLRAAAEIKEVFPAARFLIVGSGEMGKGEDYLAGLKRLAGELNLSRQVIFTGFREEIPQILSLLDILVIPSLFGEGLPLVMLEAMASGVPVVATPVDGIPEAIEDGRTGFLVAPQDPQALAGKILLLFKDKGLAGRVGLTGRELVRSRFTAERMTRQVEAVYDSFVDREGAPEASFNATGGNR